MKVISWATAVILVLAMIWVFVVAPPCEGHFQLKIGGEEHFFFDCKQPSGNTHADLVTEPGFGTGTNAGPVLDLAPDEITIEFLRKDNTKRIRTVTFNSQGKLLTGLDRTLNSNNSKSRHWEAFEGKLDLDNNYMIVDWQFSGTPPNDCWRKIRIEYRLSNEYVNQFNTESLSHVNRNCMINIPETNERIK